MGGEATVKSLTDRGKSSTKRHIVYDQRGDPLGLVVTGPDRHGKKVALWSVDAIAVGRPAPTDQEPQQLCRDKGDFVDVREGHTSQQRRKPKRWMVECIYRCVPTQIK